MQPFNLSIQLRRKFSEAKSNLLTDLFLKIEFDDILIRFPLIKNAHILSLLQKFSPKPKNKQSNNQTNTNDDEKKSLSNLKITKQSSYKNFYSVTVSRKSSAYGSINNDEFYDAYDDLEDIMLDDKTKVDKNGFDFSEVKKRKSKASKIINYFRKNETKLIELKHFISVEVKFIVKKLTLQVRIIRNINIFFW